MIENDADCVSEFLAELAKVCSPKEIEHLATHPDTPATALSHVARHPVADIRAAVAENRNTPLEAIWQLVKDDDPDVRYQLAENHNLPKEVLTALSEDDNPYVACRAQKTLSRIECDSRLLSNSSWRNFRKAQTERKVSALMFQTALNPTRTIGKLFERMFSYARAT